MLPGTRRARREANRVDQPMERLAANERLVSSHHLLEDSWVKTALQQLCRIGLQGCRLELAPIQLVVDQQRGRLIVCKASAAQQMGKFML